MSKGSQSLCSTCRNFYLCFKQNYELGQRFEPSMHNCAGYRHTLPPIKFIFDGKVIFDNILCPNPNNLSFDLRVYNRALSDKEIKELYTLSRKMVEKEIKKCR